MTETAPQESDEFDFGLHELAFVDPEVSEQLEMVKKANEYLASDTTLSMDIAQGIRRQLDISWPHMGETVMVSGSVALSDPQHTRTRAVNVLDKPLVSNGWAVEELYHLRDGRVRSVHEMHASDETVSRDDVDYTTYAIRYMFVEPRSNGMNVMYFGRVGDVSVKYGRVSDTYVSNVLHYFHPEQMDAVDDALLKADTADEQLDNLQGIDLVLENKYPDANLDFSANLSRYISMCLDLDMALPYECTVSGHTIEQQPNGSFERLGDGTLQGLVAIAGLIARLRPFLDGEEKRERTMVDFLVIGRHIKPENHIQTSVFFPLNNLTKHKSLRSSYYE